MAKKRWKQDFLLERFNADIARRAPTVYVRYIYVTLHLYVETTYSRILTIRISNTSRSRSLEFASTCLSRSAPAQTPQRFLLPSTVPRYRLLSLPPFSFGFPSLPFSSLPYPTLSPAPFSPSPSLSFHLSPPFSAFSRLLSSVPFSDPACSPTVSSSLLGSVSFVSFHSSLLFHSSIFRLIKVASRLRSCSRSRTEYTRVITQSFLPFLPRKSIFTYFLMILIVSRLRQRLYRVKEKQQRVESRKKLRYHRPRHQHHRSVSTISNTGNPLKPSVHLICVNRFCR